MLMTVCMHIHMHALLLCTNKIHFYKIHTSIYRSTIGRTNRSRIQHIEDILFVHMRFIIGQCTNIIIIIIILKEKNQEKTIINNKVVSLCLWRRTKVCGIGNIHTCAALENKESMKLVKNGLFVSFALYDENIYIVCRKKTLNRKIC